MSECILCKREVKCYDNTTRKRCPSCNTRIRRYRVKRKLVQLKGNKCNRCGWSGDIAAFEFHHINASDKDFKLSEAFIRDWNKTIQEAEKCEMLCSNCHRIEHSKEKDDLFLALVNNYRGDLLKI